MATYKLSEMLKLINDALEAMGQKGRAEIKTEDPKYADPSVWIEYEGVMLYETEIERPDSVQGKIKIPAWQIDIVVHIPGSRDVPPDQDFIQKEPIPAGYGEAAKRFLLTVYEVEIDNAIESATMAALAREIEEDTNWESPTTFTAPKSIFNDQEG